jgi:hypothetical protein
MLHGREAIFPLGIYEQPRDPGEWDAWKEAGINLACCHDAEQLEEADQRRMMAWAPVPVICRDAEEEKALAGRVKSLMGHPSIIAWEAQDEAIWNACRLDNGVVTNRIWAQPAAVREMIRTRLDTVVAGLQRGSSIVRDLDPGRMIWLNEAAKSDQETLARCLPYLDVVGYDYYPVPEDPERGRQMHMLGPYTERFRRAAPAKELWVVEQAFSWGGISNASFGSDDLIHDYNTNTWPQAQPGEPEARPGVSDLRFMAWDAIAHGATGLLWFGSQYAGSREALLGDLLAVTGELKKLQRFLVTGNLTGVKAITDNRQCPPVMGVSAVARRRPDGTLLALINEDYSDHEVAVTGMEWVAPDDLIPMVEPSDGLKPSAAGMLTSMKGHEVRLYMAH